ncbi:MAG: cytochrome P450 [Microthrixaceae bacterium]
MDAKQLPGPGRIEQVGTLRRLLADPVPVLDELSATWGPMTGLGFGPMRLAVVGDPKAVSDLFAMSTDRFRWDHKFNVLGFVVGKSSLIVSDGPEHHRRRRAVTPGFGRRRLNGWIPMIVAETDAAIDRIASTRSHSDAPLDLYPVGRNLVLRIVVRAMFGESMAAHADEIEALFQRPQAYLESPAVKQLPHPFPLTARARVRSDRRRLHAIIDEQIAQRRSSDHGEASDVLSELVTSDALSDEEIRDQVVTLIGAGYDTTSASLAWMIWRATTTRGLWERLGREARDAFGVDDPTGAEVDATLLGRLGLANGVMHETLRLHPAGVFGPREAGTDLEVGGFRIPRGTLILWSPYLVGRDPGVWPEPKRFDPDRFVELDHAQGAAAKRGWVPFGGGARNCVGFALAQMELTIIIARLAQRLRLTPTTDEVPRPYGMVVNRPIGGVPMRIQVYEEGSSCCEPTI